MLKKVTVRLTPEQHDFLVNDGGISPNVRKAVDQLRRKRKFKVQLDRANKYGHAHFDIAARDLEELLDEVGQIKEELDESATTIKKKFWYIYSIEETKEEH